MRRLAGILVLTAAISMVAASVAAAHHPAADPWTAALLGGQGQGSRLTVGGPSLPAVSASRATPTSYGDCGPGAILETGVQGQVPKADQDSGRSKQGYRCNLRLVGKNDVQDRGANFQLGWYKNCAYVGIVGNQPSQGPASPPPHPLEGVAVVDVSNPKSPKLVRILQSPVGRTQHEAVEVNERRGMLVVQIGGLAAQWIEIYDASQDCRNPQFKGRFDAGGPRYHGQRISRDGMTVYASDAFDISGGPVLDVIDVSDMTQPKLLKRWDPGEETPPDRHGIHDLDLSADGKRAYLGAAPASATIGTIVAGPPSNQGQPSMVTLDTTDIQERKPNPDLKVVSSISLPNFGHTIQHARIGGKPYVFSSGEAPVTGADNCPWAWGHVLDMSDEKKPREVSEIKLEVNEIENCPDVGQDDAGYSIHYIGVDDEKNTTKVFYTYYTGGLRVFDVRDPANPKEIAYYHPPPLESTVFQAATPFTGDRQTPGWDSATSDVRYLPETGQIWMVSIANGFQVLEGAAQGGGLPGDDCSKGPRASISRNSLRASRGGMNISGRAVAYRCVAAQLAHGTVSRVELSLARRVSGGCRFLKKNGHFSARRSCKSRIFLRGHLGRKRAGKVPWSYRTGANLAPGTYIASVRARDAAGRVSGAGGTYAVRRFSVR